MEHKVMLVEYGECKSSDWSYDTVFYEFDKNILNLSTDFFQENLNIRDIVLYPEIYINQINKTKRKQLFTLIMELGYFTETIVNKIKFLKNTRKFSEIIITNEETKVTKKLYLLKKELFRYNILESFGKSNKYEFVIPNQYFYDFISAFKSKGNIKVLDYIGANDTEFLDRFNIIKKTLIQKREKDYYFLYTELSEEIDIIDLYERPLDMTNDFDIESLIRHGNIITKTLINWYYCNSSDYILQEFTQYQILTFNNASITICPDNNIISGNLYHDGNIVISKLDINNYMCYLFINNKTSKLEIYEQSEPRTYKKDNLQFYLFGEDVICFKDHGWMFFRIDAWRSCSTNLDYFYSTNIDINSDNDNN